MKEFIHILLNNPKDIIPIFTIVMAVGTTLIWIKELISPHLKQGLLTRREGDHLVWPHIAVEAGTAILLFVSGVGSLMHLGWAPLVNFFSLGAITYACFNSLSWTLADKSRWLYSLYMLAGVVGSLTLMIIVIRNLAS
jgi:hypothetical protein